MSPKISQRRRWRFFKKAKEIIESTNDMGGPAGEEILYYFIGREAMLASRKAKEANLEAKAANLETEALDAFKQALDLNPIMLVYISHVETCTSGMQSNCQRTANWTLACWSKQLPSMGKPWT